MWLHRGGTRCQLFPIQTPLFPACTTTAAGCCCLGLMERTELFGSGILLALFPIPSGVLSKCKGSLAPTRFHFPWVSLVQQLSSGTWLLAGNTCSPFRLCEPPAHKPLAPARDSETWLETPRWVLPSWKADCKDFGSLHVFKLYLYNQKIGF